MTSTGDIDYKIQVLEAEWQNIEAEIGDIWNTINIETEDPKDETKVLEDTDYVQELREKERILVSIQIEIEEKLDELHKQRLNHNE